MYVYLINDAATVGINVGKFQPPNCHQGDRHVRRRYTHATQTSRFRSRYGVNNYRIDNVARGQ